MDEAAFTALTSAADPAMIVVTTAAEGERAGCLVGFHSQSSISPAHYSVWLSKANHTYRVALRASHLAVHILTAEDLPLAEHFGTLSGEETEKFSRIATSAGEGGVPLLEGCPHRMLLERITMLDDGGDHVVVTGTVVSARASGSLVPLRLSHVAHLRAGHDSEERAIRP
ncbi:MAG: flavin reductase family protein [Brachybacterium sp.]